MIMRWFWRAVITAVSGMLLRKFAESRGRDRRGRSRFGGLLRAGR